VETLEGRVASLGRERDELRRALTEEEQLGAEVKEHKEEVYATVCVCVCVSFVFIH